MMSKLFFLSSFFLGYLPLWSIVGGKYYMYVRKDRNDWCLPLFGLFTLAFGWIVSDVIFRVALRKYQCKQSESIVLLEIEERKSITLEMLLSYVLPLLAFNFLTYDGVISFLVFFLVMLFLAGKYSLLEGNIFMELIGYRYYDCKDQKGRRMKVISQLSLVGAIGCELALVQITDQVWLTTDGGR